MSFRKTTFTNIFQIARFTYVGEVISFLASMILARLLMPEEYGFVAMILVFTNFANILSGIGISSELIRSPYKYTFHKAMMNLAFFIGLILCVFLILLAYPIALFYGNFDLLIPTLIISLKFIPKSINSAYRALLLKNKEYSFVGKTELWGTLMSNAVMITMAFLGFSYWSLIIPTFFYDIYILLASVKRTRLKLKFYSFSHTRAAFKKSRSIISSILGVRIISYWARNLDNLLVGKFYGESSLGLYNRGYKFLGLADKLISNLFESVLYPNLQKLREEKGNVFKEYLFFVEVISLLVFPIGAILILVPDTLVRILWGPNWMDTAQYLPYFGLVIFTRATKSNIETLFKIFVRDDLLFKFGVFNSISMVAAIVVGSFHSALMIAILMALSQIIIVLPVAVYVVFWKQMKMNLKQLNLFYLHRILLMTMMVVFLWLDFTLLVWLAVTLYLIVILWDMRREFGRLSQLISTKYRKPKK